MYHVLDCWCSSSCLSEENTRWRRPRIWNTQYDIRFFLFFSQKLKAFDKDLSRKRNVKFHESVRLRQSLLTYDWWIIWLEYLSSNSFLVERRSFLTSISKKSFHGIKMCWKCYTIVTYATKCEKFLNENGEIKSIYINESYIGIDYLRWWSIPR